MKHEFTIGALAEMAGCTEQTIRYYEKERLLPLPARTFGNYRIYDRSHLNRLSFIRNCRAFDMKIPEIKQLLSLLDAPHQSCQEVNALVDQRISEVDQRLDELRQLQRKLKQLRQLCNRTDSAEDCAILETLGMPAAPNQS